MLGVRLTWSRSAAQANFGFEALHMPGCGADQLARPGMHESLQSQVLQCRLCHVLDSPGLELSLRPLSRRLRPPC